MVRLSPGHGLVCLLRIAGWLLALLGFFSLIDISSASVLACCEWLLGLFKFIYGALSWPSGMTGAQALAGMLILLPLAILVGVQLWHSVFHRGGVAVNGSFKYSAQQSQDPIAVESEDELGREKIVRHIAAIISGDIAGRHAMYLGIHGEWGAGKTSVMNLVRKKLELNRTIVFVDFSSWEHESKEDIPYVLFSRIARTVADRLDLRLAFNIFRYAVLLVPRKLISIAGPFEWALELVVRLVNALMSADELREKISNRLEDLGAKIIVVADDMDRIDPDDMRTVFRVMRTSGDLSQFVYCFLISRQHLIDGIARSFAGSGCGGINGEDRESAKEYIQKIIQLEIDLPPISVAVLENVFVKRMNDTLRGYGLPVLAFDGMWPKYFRWHVHTYREMIRLLNKLIPRVGFYKAIGGREFTVNMDDLIALTIINLYDAEFWGLLFQHRELLQNDLLERIAVGKNLDFSKIKTAFRIDGNAMRKDFLQDYMGVEFSGRDPSMSARVLVDEREAEQDRRLKATRCFRAYYSGEIPDLPEIGFKNNVLSLLGDEERLLRFLVEKNEQGVLSAGLDYLEDMPIIEDQAQRRTYFRALVRMSDMRFKAEQPFSRDSLGIEKLFDVGTRLSRCVNFMLRKLPEDAVVGRGAELLDVFRSTDAVVMLAHAVRWDDRKSGVSRDMPYFFTDAEYNQLVDLFLERVKRLQTAGKLIGYADEENLRRTWRVLFMGGRVKDPKAEVAEYKELLAKDVQCYPNVLHVLMPYRYYADCPVEGFSPMWFEKLDEELGVQNVLKTLERELDERGDEGLCRLVTLIKSSMNAYTASGEWPHPDKQGSLMGNGAGEEG